MACNERNTLKDVCFADKTDFYEVRVNACYWLLTG